MVRTKSSARLAATFQSPARPVRAVLVQQLPARDDGSVWPRVLALRVRAAGSGPNGRDLRSVPADAEAGQLQSRECPGPDPGRDRGCAWRQNLWAGRLGTKDKQPAALSVSAGRAAQIRRFCWYDTSSV